MRIEPKYPIYVISKNRAESRLTSKTLEKMRVAYRIVVEPQEYEKYAAVIDPAKILTLPFSNLGLGSIPARNWCWEHALAEGHARHWIMDDNIRGFIRYNHNSKVHVTSGNIFRAMEDFTDRYTNVPMAGPQYDYFVTRKLGRWPVFVPNTRVYSCILLANDVPHRWRGRYNEDTDLSIRFLKDGYCTLLFNAFLQMKQTTLTMKGGNMDELYKQTSEFDGRKEMAFSLMRQHPDVVTVVQKWNRWQHSVNYKPFRRNTLVRLTDVSVPNAADEYGMQLVRGGES